MQSLDFANKEPRGPNLRYTDSDWSNMDFYSEILEEFAASVKVLQGDQFITNRMMPMTTTTLDSLVIQKAC